jgi:hypothetical protein
LKPATASRALAQRRKLSFRFLDLDTVLSFLYSHASTQLPQQQPGCCSLTAQTTATMPKQSNKKQGSKQQRTKGKPYQCNNPKAVLKLPTIQHKQTAASLAKALGCHGINSLLAETAAELQEKGIKQKSSSKAGKAHTVPEQQQQQQQEGMATEQQQQQQPQQQQPATQQSQPQQQQGTHAAAAAAAAAAPPPPQPDIMSLLGGWSMKQKTEVEQGQQQQQQPQAGQQTAAV